MQDQQLAKRGRYCLSSPVPMLCGHENLLIGSIIYCRFAHQLLELMLTYIVFHFHFLVDYGGLELADRILCISYFNFFHV
jgi:hypothetical protein